ncbi:monocarboxylate transporter 12-like [Glandiceps talaboti]
MKSNERKTKAQYGSIYCWLVVLGCHVCCMFTFGTYQAIGPVIVKLQTYFNTGSAHTSWIVAILLCLELGFGPIANISVKKIGYRGTVILGGLVSSIGFLLTAFAPSLEFIYFSFGGLVGCGYGLILSPQLGIIAVYMKKRYATANALAVSGSGTGSFIFGPLWQLLIDMYGWRGSFIVFAAVNANLCVCGAFFRPLDIQTDKRSFEMTVHQSVDENLPDATSTETQNNSDDETSALRKVIEVCDCGLFSRYPTFTLITVAYLLGIGVAFIGAPAHMIARAKSQSLASAGEIALILSVMGALGLMGRLVPPVVLHLFGPSLTSLRLCGMAFAFTGITHLLSPLADSYVTYCTYAALIGLFSGTFFTSFSNAVKDVVGSSNLTAGMALATPVASVGALIGPPISGWIYDSTNDYNNSFYFYGSCSAVTGLTVLLLESPLQRCKVKTGSGSEGNVETEDGCVNPVAVRIEEI